MNILTFIKITNWLMLHSFLAESFMVNTADILDSDCQQWSKKHIFSTNERHYNNVSSIVITFNQISELTKTCPHSGFDAGIVYFYPSKEILMESTLDLRNLLNVFNVKYESKLLIFENLKGFNHMFNARPIKHFSHNYTISFYNAKFDFFLNATRLITKEHCSHANFEAKIANYFGSMHSVFFADNTLYSKEVCPYVFMSTHIRELNLMGIVNSYIYKNQLEFMTWNDTVKTHPGIHRLEYVAFNLIYERVTLKLVNPLIFKRIKTLVVQGLVYDMQTDLFAHFKKVKCVSLIIENIETFLHSGGTKWMSYLNRDLNVDLSQLNKSQHVFNSVIVLQIMGSGANKLLFNRGYVFPDKDICLFKEFPHKQLVYPGIFFEKETFKCTCTVIWLIRYTNVYRTSDYSAYESPIISVYPAYYAKFSALNCLTDLVEQIRLCEFEKRFAKCNLSMHSPLSKQSNKSLSSTDFIKWLQYIIEVFLKPFLCLTGIVTNSLTIGVLKNKLKKASFAKSMYSHMLANAVFNLIFCIVSCFSLMNVCIYPKTAFCSRIYKEALSQYFKIYVVEFFGEAVCFCCNFSFFTFSVSRFIVSTSNSGKCRNMLKKLEKIKVFHLYGFVFGIGILLNMFKIVEYKKNEKYSTADINFPFNAYDIVYCENRLLFSSTFVFRCKIFPILNLINSVLNNIVYLFVSLVVDVLLINFTNKNLERKKKLTKQKEKLDEAVKLKEKVNEMIITNGSLYFVSHFPQFLVTLVSFIFKGNLSLYCLYYFPCDDFLDTIQTFSLVSIVFQFFIYKKFDKNMRESFEDLNTRFQLKLQFLSNAYA